jgi:hypothetical protein
VGAGQNCAHLPDLFETICDFTYFAWATSEPNLYRLMFGANQLIHMNFQGF